MSKELTTDHQVHMKLNKSVQRFTDQIFGSHLHKFLFKKIYWYYIYFKDPFNSEVQQNVITHICYVQFDYN
jgi:hypothetical protein